MKRALEKGQSYVSVMTDLDGSRVLEVVEDRTEEAADKLWKSLFTASVGF
jgi:transposase